MMTQGMMNKIDLEGQQTPNQKRMRMQKMMEILVDKSDRVNIKIED